VNGGRSGFLDRQVSSCFRFELIPHQNVRCGKRQFTKNLAGGGVQASGVFVRDWAFERRAGPRAPGGKVETRLLKFAAGATLQWGA
jgi:hypothetical protein